MHLLSLPSHPLLFVQKCQLCVNFYKTPGSKKCDSNFFLKRGEGLVAINFNLFHQLQSFSFNLFPPNEAKMANQPCKFPFFRQIRRRWPISYVNSLFPPLEAKMATQPCKSPFFRHQRRRWPLSHANPFFRHQRRRWPLSHENPFLPPQEAKMETSMLFLRLISPFYPHLYSNLQVIINPSYSNLIPYEFYDNMILTQF